MIRGVEKRGKGKRDEETWGEAGDKEKRKREKEWKDEITKRETSGENR